INNFKCGKSCREISKIVNRSVSTVQYVLKRYKTENRLVNKPKTAHNKKLTPTDERWIVRQVQMNPTLSAPKLAAQISERIGKTIHPENVQRVLRKHNYNARIARKIPFINSITVC